MQNALRAGVLGSAGAFWRSQRFPSTGPTASCVGSCPPGTPSAGPPTPTYPAASLVLAKRVGGPAPLSCWCGWTGLAVGRDAGLVERQARRRMASSKWTELWP